MFRVFKASESISGQNPVKSSVQRTLRQKLIDQFGTPEFEAVVDEILPKKGNLLIHKCRDHITLLSMDGQILFFNSYDGPYYPTLKLLHKYPDILPRMQVDKGAIKFVISGANIMCPGLTSKGARMPDKMIEKDQVVAIYAEGKENAVAIGKMVLSSEEIKTINKDVGIESLHYLTDGLWHTILE